MSEQEGVIKFQLHFQRQSVLSAAQVQEISGWRTLMHQCGMLGQHPQRYDNYGFGNISQLTIAGQFIISGSQTGLPLQLPASGFAEVIQVDIAQNTLWARGECQPSSESMTHAAVYQANPLIRVVIHAHCPAIWRSTGQLQLPHTSADIPYGTVEMARAVAALVKQQEQAVGLFTMLGHEDGVVVYATNFSEASTRLLDVYVRAVARGEKPNLR